MDLWNGSKDLAKDGVDWVVEQYDEFEHKVELAVDETKEFIITVGDIVIDGSRKLVGEVKKVVEVGGKVFLFLKDAPVNLYKAFMPGIQYTTPARGPRVYNNTDNFDALWNEIGEVDFIETLKNDQRFSYTYEDPLTLVNTEDINITVSPRAKIDLNLYLDLDFIPGNPYPLSPLKAIIRKWDLGLDGAILAELIANMKIDVEKDQTYNVSIPLPAPHPLAVIITAGLDLDIGVQINGNLTGEATIGYQRFCPDFHWRASAKIDDSWGITGFETKTEKNEFKDERIGPDYELKGGASITPYVNVSPTVWVLGETAKIQTGLKVYEKLSAQGEIGTDTEARVSAEITAGMDISWGVKFL